MVSVGKEVTLSLFLILLLPFSAWSHGGGLDAIGCHHNQKFGGYHCHQGPLAGKFFDSEIEAIPQLALMSRICYSTVCLGYRFGSLVRSARILHSSFSMAVYAGTGIGGDCPPGDADHV